MKKIILSLSCLCAATFINAQTVTVSTITGAIPGLVDSTCGWALFSAPVGVAVDATGNVFVADKSNYCIRKISTSCIVSTFAGGSIPGTVDGVGTAARFGNILGMTIDGSGNLFVTDGFNRIRKVTPSAVVSTVAGTTTAGYADGSAASAKFNGPAGMAVDAAGNIYVADALNHRIRKISTTGIVSTFAGIGIAALSDGVGTAAYFNKPTGLAFDAVGNLFVADRNNHCIRKITPAGVVSTFAGSAIGGYVDGTGSAAKLFEPTSIVFDAAGNMYITERYNNRIRKISPTAVVKTIAGDFVGNASGIVDGVGSIARFSYPAAITIDNSGNLIVADEDNNRIRKLTFDGVSGINENNIAKNFSAYPNPTTGILNIDFSNSPVTEMVTEQGRSIEVTITNTLGQVVLNDKITETHSSFNIQYFVSGIYFVTVTDSRGNKSVKKIIKE